jgi:hypothetical protein
MPQGGGLWGVATHAGDILVDSRLLVKGLTGGARQKVSRFIG